MILITSTMNLLQQEPTQNQELNVLSKLFLNNLKKLFLEINFVWLYHHDKLLYRMIYFSFVV